MTGCHSPGSLTRDNTGNAEVAIGASIKLNKTVMKESAVQKAGQDLVCPRVEEGKFLSFFLGDEEYAISIRKVQEIIGLMSITPVPRMPSHICGVLNLRGKIVPVMNLRLRFGLPAVKDTPESCVIVVQEAHHLMGILVDKVSEVADILGSEIEEVPSVGESRKDAFLSGIGKSRQSVKMIVDVHKAIFKEADELPAPS